MHRRTLGLKLEPRGRSLAFVVRVDASAGLSRRPMLSNGVQVIAL